MENPEENAILQRWVSQGVAATGGQQSSQNNSNKRRRIADATEVDASIHDSPAPSIEEVMPTHAGVRIEPVTGSRESLVANGLCRVHSDSDSARAFLAEATEIECKERHHDSETSREVTGRIELKKFMRGLKRRNYLAWKHVADEYDRHCAFDKRRGIILLTLAEWNISVSVWDILGPLKCMRAMDKCYLCEDPNADPWKLETTPPRSPQPL